MTAAVTSATVSTTRASRRVLRRLAASLVTIAVLAGAGSYLGVSYVIAERFSHADRHRVGRAPMVAAAAYEDVAFATSDGLTLRGWFFRAPGDRAAIIVHGKDGNRIGGEHRINERLAEYLIARGFSVLLFDLRGSGESDGDRFSLGYLERRDVAAAVDLVAARGYRQDRIALIGISMGAGTVLQTLLLRPDVGAVVADSAYEDARTIVTENLETLAHVPSWFTPGVLVMSNLAFGLNGDAVRPIDVVRAHPERAFLFIHCTADELIPTHHAYELKAASANPASELWMATACQHSWAFPTYPEAYEAHLIAFLDARIPAVTAH